MATPILATKLYIPPLRPKAVARPRLVERLHAGLHRKLTLISAPAGFGKTTLVGEWVAGGARPAAWLSLDEGDGERVRFLSYLIAAVQTVAPALGQAAAAAMQAQPPPDTGSILTVLVNELAAAEPLLLVLDDYHAVESRAVDEAIGFLLDHLPPQVHLVLATREDPPLPLARLRARGQLTELRAADLRFTEEEAAAFLERVMDVQLSAADVAALERRTEGWIAGLQLAALSMQGRADVHGFVRAFTGDNRYIFDYLIEEVLQRQPDEVHAFLLQTSILARLSAPLCDAVRFGAATDAATTGSQAILESLERGNLFVIPLDDRRGWFRYHPLFADVLRSHLLDELPELAPDLHSRAADWYERNGMRADAVRHALAAENFERAAALVELAWPEMDGTFQPSTWLRWKLALPEAVVKHRPVLQAAHAWALLDGGEMEAGAAQLGVAESLLESPADELVVVDAEQFRTLPASIATARAYHAQALGDGAATIRHGRRALDLLRADDHVRRGPPAALMSMAFWADGRLEEAAQALTDAGAEFERAGHLTFAVSGTFGLADMRLAQGRLREAERVYERALQLAVHDGVPVVRGAAYLYLGLSELRREQNDLAASEALLRESEALRDQPPLTNFQYRFHLAEARLHETAGAYDEALARLDAAAGAYVRTPIPDVRPIPALRARVWLAQGRVDEALAWAQGRGLSADDELSYLREFEHMMLARTRVSRYARDGDEAGLRAAHNLLRRLLQAAEAGGRLGSALEILILQALAHRAGGDWDAATTSLQRALSLAEAEGYVRVFVDEGAPMAELLRRMKDEGGRMKAYAGRLLAAFAGESDRQQITAGRPAAAEGSAAAGQPLMEPLSERELEVLALVADGLTNRQIGDRLYLALDTVKGHNRSIYGKLGVQRRTEAVARARELGLL